MVYQKQILSVLFGILTATLIQISLSHPVWAKDLSHLKTEKTEQAKPRKQYNRLVHEKSPYLLQHAKNPIHWYAWGEEALAAAWAENKPIFLSIGYSTCHWCHVMETETFENEEVAALLNEGFIAIKVDREEMPMLTSST
jgi:thioredoxin-related protein